tara:strand:- start:1335 stop:1601 length:267 start_codon:yes stop_codon:yes gene_type:complete
MNKNYEKTLVEVLTELVENGEITVAEYSDCTILMTETNDKNKCKKHLPYYQEEEKENNVPERYYCKECNIDLPMPEPDWDAIAKEKEE